MYNGYQFFSIYHNTNVPPRNSAEREMVRYILADYKDFPFRGTIEQFREQVISKYKWISHKHGRFPGKLEISELRTMASIAGHPNWVTRGFAIYGRGRKTYTVTINEEIFKDANNGYRFVKNLIFNKSEIDRLKEYFSKKEVVNV